MDGINARSSAQEVRALTGYDRTEWNYFHKVAYAKAREFVIANRDSLTTWGDVPYGQRRAMLEDLNQHLEEQRVHPVSDEVFHWKCCQMMPKMIKEMKKADALQEEQKYDASGPGSEVRVPWVSYPVQSAEGRHNGCNWFGWLEIHSYRANRRLISPYLCVR